MPLLPDRTIRDVSHAVIAVPNPMVEIDPGDSIIRFTRGMFHPRASHRADNNDLARESGLRAPDHVGLPTMSRRMTPRRANLH
jgi:hypothetical protein